MATLSARVGRLMPVSADLGQLAAVLEKAGRPDPGDRSTAAEFGRSLVRAAETLPRPKPIPIVVVSPFADDPSRMRRPNDPTGGITRPDAPAPAPVAAPVPASDARGAGRRRLVDRRRRGRCRAGGDALPPPARTADAPWLYDGDTDRTIDELAELGRPGRRPSPRPEPADAPPAEPAPAPEEPRRPAPALGAVADRPAGARRARPGSPCSPTAVRGAHARGASARRPRRAGRPRPDRRLRLGPRRAERAQRRAADRRRDHPHCARRRRGARRGRAVPRRRQRGAGVPSAAGARQPDARRRRDGARRAATRRPAPPPSSTTRSCPPGTVVSWSVPADPSLGVGGDVLPETQVAIVVSSGPAPRTVPELAGQTVEAATAAIEGIQLVPAVAEAVFSDTVPAGSVVSIDPVAGTQVARGATVTMVPSKGVDLVTMPNLTGLTLPQAQEALTAAGLQVGTLLGNSLGTVRLGLRRRRPRRSRRAVPPRHRRRHDLLLSLRGGLRFPREPWDPWTAAWRSSPVPGEGSGVSTPCCSPPRAPRSWSTTGAARTRAPARTRARPTTSSPRSRPPAARRSPTPTTSPTGTAPSTSSTRRSTPSAASTSSSTTPASCATACSST